MTWLLLVEESLSWPEALVVTGILVVASLLVLIFMR